MRHKTTDWPAYFAARVAVDPATDCWNWTLRLGPDGYGFCHVIRDVTVMAHRVSYIKLVGPIPDGLTLDHLCRNRACVNPAHLEPVTMRVNTLRAPSAMASINAAKTHCINGHEFTPDNIFWRESDRTRVCRSCSRDRSARSKAKRVSA